jgi:LmbE family N-acetylglucosaminyl deacetylase
MTDSARATVFDPDPANRWLFCFTHPDDEVSICAWMSRLAQSNVEVHAGWSVSNDVREAESRAAMSRLGLQQERLHYFRFPDKGACDSLPQLADSWSRVIADVNPHVVAVGAFECGHIDHDATNFAVNAAVRAASLAVSVCEIPWYHPYTTRIPTLNRFADPKGEHILELTREECRLKRQFAQMYPSQNIASLLVWYTVLGWLKLRPPALCRTERMRLQTHFNFLEPNLPEPMKSKVIASPTWQRWAEAVRRTNPDLRM